MTIRPSSESDAQVLHPTLARTFAKLDLEDVGWCVLRGERELDGRAPEVDLLVRHEDRRAAERVFRRLGYMPLPPSGRGTHRSWVTYVEEDDRWFKLDTVTALAYGPQFELDTRSARAVLSRRTRSDGVWMLSRTDRFWALLLHCVLDRSTVPRHRTENLHDLARTATADSPLADWFDHHAPTCDPSRAIAAARRSDWASLSDVGTSVLASNRSRSRSVRLLGTAWAAVGRLRVLPTLTLNRGLSVALLGPDGAGKSTVAASIGRRLPISVRTVYMGLFSRDRIVGRPPSGGMEHAARLARHIARQWAGYLRALRHRLRGRLVVYDRFSYDAVLREPRREWVGGRLRRWALAHAVPPPDLVIILDAPAAVLHARSQEHDVAALDSQRRGYLRLSERVPNAHVIRTDRTSDEVERDITRLIWRAYAARRGRANSASSR